MQPVTSCDRPALAVAISFLIGLVGCSSSPSKSSDMQSVQDLRTRQVNFDALGLVDGLMPGDGPGADLRSTPPDLKPVCMTDTDCGGGLACKSPQMCTTCTTNDDCTSKVCDRFTLNADNNLGYCKESVVYVDNKNGTCSSGGSGSAADPYCMISTAIKSAPPGYVIRVLPSTMSYDQIAMTAGSASIYATPPMPAFPPTTSMAQISNPTNGANKIGVSVGGSASLLLDGFDVANYATGVQCSGASTLVLRQSTIQGCTSGVISGSLDDSLAGCTLTVDSDLLMTNGIALYLGQSTKYTVYNNFVVANSPSDNDAAVRMSNGIDVTSKFQYNTVAHNIAGPKANSVGGIDCGRASPKIEDSIFADNSMAAQSQLFNLCSLTNVVVGAQDMTTLAGAVKQAPAFVSPGAPNFDYSLLNGAADSACCIGKAQMNTAVKRDYFANSRPWMAPGPYDIGAQQVQ